MRFPSIHPSIHPCLFQILQMQELKEAINGLPILKDHDERHTTVKPLRM